MGRGFDNIDKEFIFEKRTKVSNIAQKKNNIKYVPLNLKTPEIKTGIVWTPNCTILLYYHRFVRNLVKKVINRLDVLLRWLNDLNDEKHILQFQNNYKIIYSSAGIVVVEIREVVSEMLIKWWDLTKNFENSFEIPRLDVPSYVLIAQDRFGNILKETFE